ncbi:hypothetical protein HanIR_Chr17g0880461 [Helianthus annuus]|nr:hypothetical protein HanIR_Chr17g0880461 [Helianthus annuus]
MRQRQWVELLNDYDCVISYLPGKANTVADTLSRKERVKLHSVQTLFDIQSLVLQAQRSCVNEGFLKYELPLQFELKLEMKETMGCSILRILVDDYHPNRSPNWILRTPQYVRYNSIRTNRIPIKIFLSS